MKTALFLVCFLSVNAVFAQKDSTLTKAFNEPDAFVRPNPVMDYYLGEKSKKYGPASPKIFLFKQKGMR